ncbi:S-linalool synthase [Rutidosis leptorrhynchoides]|uniref:S-linalool synthase n=1 Tax=Rutidosis leptorrhynchoides TaxID=125765 RepID=UPI003A9A4F7E
MEPSLASIHNLVTKLKVEMFSKTKGNSFVSPSAYDTAWLAMIPHPMKHNTPLFMGCLDWILDNQNDRGYWGQSHNADNKLPTIDAITCTLTCMIVLRKWGVGAQNVEKGLKFIDANMEDMLRDQHRHCFPRRFTIVFPAIIDLAESLGLELKFSGHIKSLISEISYKRQQVLSKEDIVDKLQYPPLLAYLETFQSTKYNVDEKTIMKHLSEDGSLFQSPSATAQAYLSTGNQKCLEYMMSLVQMCPNGVPQKYPMDEELMELSMVDQVKKLGLSEYFTQEIDNILRKAHRSYMNKETVHDNMNFIAEKLYKDALAFRLFRMQGYKVSPSIFCWFLYENEILNHLKNNCGQFTSLLYNVYKATDLIFSGETEVDEARSFSKKLLQKISTMKNVADDNVVILPNIFKVIDEELRIPWIARLDHLDHRMWIEQNKEGPLWVGKACFYTLSCVHNVGLMQLAVENYAFRQSIYQNELKEIKRWSKESGLTEMGFGREKTTYCYFAVAASTCLPDDSVIRKLVAKSAILITVADDFFDMEGSLEELHILNEAVHRWDGKGLIGSSKIIFDVLDDLVRNTTMTMIHHGNVDLTQDFRDIWREIFNAWLTETIWGKSGYKPSLNEYLETGMISIATHVLVLTSSCFLDPSLPRNKVKPQKYENITQSLMATTRLLNDIQSYQKEQEEGTMNLVLLHYNENPETSMNDSISEVQKFLELKRKELLEEVFTDTNCDNFTKQWKYLHLSCFKVFQMLFNSGNLYDTKSELVSDIEKAIFIPPGTEFPKYTKPLKTLRTLPEKGKPISARYGQPIFRRYGLQGHMNIGCHQVFKKSMRNVSSKVYITSPMFSLRFI